MPPKSSPDPAAPLRDGLERAREIERWLADVTEEAWTASWAHRIVCALSYDKRDQEAAYVRPCRALWWPGRRDESGYRWQCRTGHARPRQGPVWGHARDAWQMVSWPSRCPTDPLPATGSPQRAGNRHSLAISREGHYHLCREVLLATRACVRMDRSDGPGRFETGRSGHAVGGTHEHDTSEPDGDP